MKTDIYQVQYELLADICKCKCNTNVLHDYNVIKCRMINAKRTQEERSEAALVAIKSARRTDENGKVSYQFHTALTGK